MLRYVLGLSPPHFATQEMAPGFAPAESISVANKRQIKVSYSFTAHIKSQQLHMVTCNVRRKQTKSHS